MTKRGRKPRNVKPKNSLTSKRHGRHNYGGPAAHKNAVETARELDLITNRALQASRLFRDEGLTFEEIGKRLGVSNSCAFNDCISVQKAMPLVLGHEGMELLKHRAYTRLNKLIRVHLARSLKGETDSAAIVVRALEREARMLGYDAQREDGFSADQVATVLRGLRQMIFLHVTDENIRRAIADDLQRQSGLLGGDVIDVNVKPSGNGSSGNGSGGTSA